MTRRLGYGRAYLDRTNLADGGPLRFVASSTAINRYGFALNQSHWLLDNYRSNGVVLWAHDASIPPIGRADAIPQPGQLLADITFDLDDDLGRKVDRKYRIGHMAAVSVGFDFTREDGSPIDDPWRLTAERIRDECWYDLAEISAVPVPADPQALRQTHSALSRLGAQFVELLDEYEHGDSPVDEIRAAVRAELAALGVDLAALPVHNTAVVEGEWDGPAAVARCPAERGALRAIHAWVDPAGDPDAKASYKFPHHATPGGPANLAGVRNALARLPQADIPDADRAGVERHLRNHLEAQDRTEQSAPQHMDLPSRQELTGIERDAAAAVLAAFNIIGEGITYE